MAEIYEIFFHLVTTRVNIIINIVNVFVLFITAVIVLMYTKAAQKSNEIQERPILNMYLKVTEDSSNPYTLHLRNMGNGPAYNINFKDADIKAGGYNYSPYFEQNPILEKNGEKIISFCCNPPEGGREDYNVIEFFKRLFPNQSNSNNHEQLKRTSAIFLIKYEGINGKKYYSVFRLYPKNLPHMELWDLFVVEFVAHGGSERESSFNDAYKLCKDKETTLKMHGKYSLNVSSYPPK